MMTNLFESDKVMQKSTKLSSLKNSTVFAGLSRFGARFRRDQQGVAAIEFAFIAPVMLLIYFGLVEISLLVEADRNVTQAASLVGDLAAQEDTLTSDMMENYINAAIAVLGTNQTNSQNSIGVEVTSFEAVADSSAADGRKINEIGYASYGKAYDGGTVSSSGGGSSTTTGGTHYDASSISATLLPAGSGIVVARMNYEYSSPLQYFVKTQTLRETFFLKPRRSATVTFDNGNASNPSNMSCSMTGTTTFAISCVPS